MLVTSAATFSCRCLRPKSDMRVAEEPSGCGACLLGERCIAVKSNILLIAYRVVLSWGDGLGEANRAKQLCSQGSTISGTLMV